MKRLKLIFWLLLAINILLVTSVKASNVWIENNVVQTEVFQKVFFYLSSWNEEKALEELQNIVEQYPGTSYAANAQLFKIELYEEYFSDYTKTIQEYQSILQSYPDTPYCLIARKELLIEQNFNDFQDYLIALDRIITEVNGESIFDILQGNSVNFNANQIPLQYRDVVARFYNQVATSYEYGNNFANAARLYVFIRQNFPGCTRFGVEESLPSCVLSFRGITDTSKYPKDKYPPLITPIIPFPGMMTYNPQPLIIFTLIDGDICSNLVNLSKLKFTLDGNDVTSKMKISSLHNYSALPWVPFEKFIISYKPETPLAVGRHTVFVEARDYGGYTSRFKWCFTILQGCWRGKDDQGVDNDTNHWDDKVPENWK